MEYRSNFKFMLCEKTTNNFETLKKEVFDNGFINISEEGNEKSIYTKLDY